MSNTFKDALPQELVTHITAICGSRGEAWFDRLPQIINELESEWSISVRQPFPGIEYNFVAPAITNSGEDVVLKIAPPFELTEIHGEAKYLSCRHGHGAVKLLAEDRERKAILLERAIPGRALHEEFSSSPLDCIEPAISVLKRNLLPAPSDMADVPTLDDWFENFRRYSETDFPKRMAEKAFEIYERLSANREKTYYIHGDYHLGNIVTAEREEFLAIDPKGIVGHVGYDIAVFLINLERWQRETHDLESILDTAIRRFAEAFDLSEREVREWVFAHMVIGAWWNFDDMPELYDAELAMPAIWSV